MKQTTILLLWLVPVNMPLAACGEDWTQFRGWDFMRTSVKNIAPQWDSEGIAWRTPLPGRGASSPVVFNDRIYLTAYTGYAIDRREPGDPYEQRLQPLAREIYATPLLANGRLYYVSRENGIFVVAAKPEFALLAHTPPSSC